MSEAWSGWRIFLCIELNGVIKCVIKRIQSGCRSQGYLHFSGCLIKDTWFWMAWVLHTAFVLTLLNAHFYIFTLL